MTDKLQIPSFLRRGRSEKFTEPRRVYRKRKPIPPKNLGKTWDDRLKRSELVQLHFTAEHPQISGVHAMWAFVGRRWVHLCSGLGTVRFKMKRADFEKILLGSV